MNKPIVTLWKCGCDLLHEPEEHYCSKCDTVCPWPVRKPTEPKLAVTPSLPSYPLFNLMSREHGLTLIESELWEIIRTCRSIESEPTPEQLRKMAEWFDDPKNPAVSVALREGVFTPGQLLRHIAEDLDTALHRRMADTLEKQGGAR